MAISSTPLYTPTPPTIVPQLEDVRNATDWVQRELHKISLSLSDISRLQLAPISMPPDTPREGLIAYADGINWNPDNNGAGLREFRGGVWRSLEEVLTASAVIGDANYTILPSDRLVVSNATFTAPRTWTLPATASVPIGARIMIFGWGANGANTLTIAAVGGDVISVVPAQFNAASMVSGGQWVWAEFIAWRAGFWILSNSGAFTATLPGQVNLSGGGTTKFLRADGTWAAPAVNPLTPPTYQNFLSGSGNYTPTAGVIRIRVRMRGGGGGGAASNTNNGANGNDSTFGGWTAVKGNGGTTASGSGGGLGGTGGANGTGTLISRNDGGSGTNGGADAGATGTGGPGGTNGKGCGGGQRSAAGFAAPPNSGGGGGGGSVGAGASSGGGGGASEYLEFVVTSPGVIAYVVGAGGAGGVAGGQAGGNGGSGEILIEEFYY